MRELTSNVAKGGLPAELRAAFRAAAHVWVVMAGAMQLSALADLTVGDGDWRIFAISSGLILALSGLAIQAARGDPPRPTQRFGFLLVTVVWITTPMVAALPLTLYGLSLTDALFESVSGFTTTGSTVMAGLDQTPHGVLLWRSLTQWLGGVGILALGVVLLPFLNIGGMQLFSKESSDRADKPLPRFIDFARSLIVVYLGLSFLCLLAYHAAGMSLWEAINHAMTTVSTGGYSTYDASFGHFDDPTLYWIATLFMIAGGLPFSMYIAFLFRRRAFRLDPQAPVVLAIYALATLSLTLWRPHGLDAKTLAEDAFNVVSVVTTTGYATSDYTLWGGYSVGLFYLLMFLGAAAGSTSGGLKTYRLIVMFSLLWAHLRASLHPHQVAITRYGGARVDPSIFRASLVFVVAFGATLMAGTLALTACGLDLITAHSGALTALTNVGPGLGAVIGPAGNFASLPDAAKWALSLIMLLGRLEIFPLVAVLIPAFWRE